MSGHPRLDNGLMEETLFTVADWLDSFGAEYFLDCGVLLGAIWKRDFLDIDYDIDLGLKKGWYPTVREKTRHGHLPRGLQFIWAGHDAMIYMLYKKVAHVDLAFFTKVKHQGQYEYWCKNDSGYHYYHPAIHLDSLDNIVFKGRRFLVPHLPELCLKHHYGPVWREHKKSPDWHQNPNVRRFVNGEWRDNDSAYIGYPYDTGDKVTQVSGPSGTE